VYIARKKKRKARVLWTHILNILYISRQICNRTLRGQCSPSSQRRQHGSPFRTLKNAVYSSAGRRSERYTNHLARAASRKADNQAAVYHSVKCSDGNPYHLVVLAVHTYTPTSCLEDEKRRLDKGRHSNNHPLQNH